MNKDNSVYAEILSFDSDMVDFICDDIKNHPDYGLLSEKEKKQAEKVIKYFRHPRGRRPNVPEGVESILRDSLG
jgi:hypothetical protein